jgi:ATP-binding cassette subfamily B protein
MAAYVFYFNKRMNIALRSRDRIGDINAQLEDTLAGIRVVKSLQTKKSKKGSLPTKTIVL